MDTIFENIFVLVPVAIVLFLRLFGSSIAKKTKAASAARAARPSARPSARPAKRAAKPTATTAESPFALLWKSLTGTQTPQKREPELLHFEERAGTFPRVAAVASTGGHQRAPVSKTTHPEPRTTTAAPASGQPRGTLPARLQRLPPLRQAVVMAELLGPPLALRPRTRYGERD
ncbi:MAG: hypothetical protein JXM71_11580 [Spirochaetales bacterium]|nr:hypothetical protein [Spirochaetales bacterium]